MRSAPAVQVQLGNDAWWRAGCAGCCAAAAASPAAWLAGWAQAPSPVMLAAAAVAALAGARLARRWLPAPAGVLSWDGSTWSWNGCPGSLAVAFDTGPWLLLRFTPEGEGTVAQLPVSRASAGSGWHGLRAAVYSRRPDHRTPSAPRM